MKQVVISAIFLLGFASLSIAQQSIQWSAGLDRSYRILRTDVDSAQFIIDKREVESPRITGHFGFFYNKPIHKKWFLRTGIGLITMGHHGENRFGLFPNGVSAQFQINSEYFFLEIPLVLRHQFIEGPWSPFAEIAVNPSIFLVEKRTQILNGNKSNNWINNADNVTSTFNVFQWSASAGLGMQYQHNDQWQFFTKATSTAFITPLVDAPINEHPFSVGIELGCRKIIANVYNQTKSKI